jgi:hypothetical protein
MKDAIEDFRRTVPGRTPEAVRLARRARHNFQQVGREPVREDEPRTLEHLMRDYVGHLKGHLRRAPGGGD